MQTKFALCICNISTILFDLKSTTRQKKTNRKTFRIYLKQREVRAFKEMFVCVCLAFMVKEWIKEYLMRMTKFKVYEIRFAILLFSYMLEMTKKKEEEKTLN